MHATQNTPNSAARRIRFVLVGPAMLAFNIGGDHRGLGKCAAYSLVGVHHCYQYGVRDWSAQPWSDVILYDDCMPCSTWDAYDLRYPN